MYGLSNLSNKEDEEENIPKEKLTFVHISQQIDYLLELEANKPLERMKYELLDYKQELEDYANTGKKIRNEYFKKCLFSHLENLLLNAIYIPMKQIRDDKLRQMDRWFTDKLTKFNSLDNIRNRTAQNIDEIFLKEELPSGEILIQDDQYEYEEFQKHRTDIQGLEPPKNRLKEFKTKAVCPPKRFRKDDKVLADLRFNLERFKGRVGSANSSITLKSTFYATKTGQKWFSNSGVPVTADLLPIVPRKEVKADYTYMRPEYEYSHLGIENKIVQAKNKEFAKKRNEEEIKKYLIEFGKTKAAYNEEMEMKANYNNMIKHYDKVFNKDLLKEDMKVDKVIDYKELGIEDLQGEDGEIDLDNQSQKVIYSRIKDLPLAKGANLLQDNTKCYTVYTTINREDFKGKILSNQKDKNIMQSDTRVTGMINDKVFAARQMGNLMCKVNEIDAPKSGYAHHYVPLSAFDNLNYEAYGPEKLMPTKTIARPKTAQQFASSNFSKYKDDFLELRKQMENYKQNELWELEKNFGNERASEKVEELRKFFEPKPEQIYPTSFLPRPKTGLLKKPVEPPTKRKRPVSKKKKW